MSLTLITRSLGRAPALTNTLHDVRFAPHVGQGGVVEEEEEEDLSYSMIL
jgi:hypothetical protein